MKISTTFLAALLAAAASANPLIVRNDNNNNNRGKHCGRNGTLPSDPTHYTGSDIFVPVSPKHPDTQFGPTKNPYVTPNDFCTVFHHIIPVSTFGKFCTLTWYLPSVANAPNPYEFVGGGSFQFTGFTYNPSVTANTTWNTLPPFGPAIPTQVFKMGNTYVIDGGPCGIQEGQKQPSTIGGMLCSTDTTLGFLASEEKCPIGPFILFSDTPGYFGP